MDAAQLQQLLQAAGMPPGQNNNLENMVAMNGMFMLPPGAGGEDEEVEDELSPAAREVHSDILAHVRADQDDDDLVAALLSSIPISERPNLIHADWEQLLRDVAVHGNARILKILLQHGGDAVEWDAGAGDDSYAEDPMNGEHAQMNTIFGRACRSGQKAVIRILQEHADMPTLTCGAPNQGALEAGHRSHDGIVELLMDAPAGCRPDPLCVEYAGGPVIAAPAAGGCLGDLREMMAWAVPTTTKAHHAWERDQAMAGAAALAIQRKRESVLPELLHAEAPFHPQLNLATEHAGTCLSALAMHTQATDVVSRLVACRIILQLARAAVPEAAAFHWEATRSILQNSLLGAPVDADAHLAFMESGPGSQVMRIGRHNTRLTRAAAQGAVQDTLTELAAAALPCDDAELADAVACMHAQEAFVAASQGGFLNLCAALLSSPASAFWDGLSPETADLCLVEACARGDAESVDWLLKKTQASVTAHAQLGFRLACRRGHSDCVQALLGVGGAPLDPHEGGEEAFIGACAGGHVDVAELLVRHAHHGGRMLDAGTKGNSALLWSAKGGHGGCVQWLLGLPAQHNVHIGQDDGIVLLVAAQGGDAGMVQLLLARETDWKQDILAQSAEQAALNGNHECLKALLLSPAGESLPLSANHQALFTAACKGGSVEAVAFLGSLHKRWVDPWSEGALRPTFWGGFGVTAPRAQRVSERRMPSFEAACSASHWSVVELMLGWKEAPLTCPDRAAAISMLHGSMVPDSVLVKEHGQRWLNYTLHVLSLQSDECASVAAVGRLLLRCLHWLNIDSGLDDAAAMGICAALAALAPHSGSAILHQMFPGQFDPHAFKLAAVQRVNAAGGGTAAVLSLLQTGPASGTAVFPGFSQHEFLPLLVLVRHVVSMDCPASLQLLPFLLARCLQEWGVAGVAADVGAAKHGQDEQLRVYRTGQGEAFSGVWARFSAAVRSQRWRWRHTPVLCRAALASSK